MARKPILDVQEVEVERKRAKGVWNNHFSNGHIAPGESRQCFFCHEVWPNLWNPLAPCAKKCPGGCNGGCPLVGNLEADR